MQNAVTLLIGGDQPAAACGQLLVVPELEEGLDQALPGDSVCLASQGPHQVYRSTVLDVFLVIDFYMLPPPSLPHLILSYVPVLPAAAWSTSPCLADFITLLKLLKTSKLNDVMGCECNDLIILSNVFFML